MKKGIVKFRIDEKLKAEMMELFTPGTLSGWMVSKIHDHVKQYHPKYKKGPRVGTRTTRRGHKKKTK